jgi:hypothetical protein
MAQPHGVALVVLLLLAKIGFAAPPDIPERFEFRFDGRPIWISAPSAITADGRVRPGVLRPEVRDELLDRRREDAIQVQAQASVQADSSSRCDATFFGGLHGSDAGQATTFADLVDIAASRSVVSGNVSGTVVGLHAGKPYTIVQIQTDVPVAGGSVAYLLYPDGKLRFDGMTVCNDDPAFAAPPAVGDAVTFVTGSAIDSTGALFVTDGSLILYDHDGAVVLPPAFESDAKLRLIPSARELARVLREAREPRRASIVRSN